MGWPIGWPMPRPGPPSPMACSVLATANTEQITFDNLLWLGQRADLGERGVEIPLVVEPLDGQRLAVVGAADVDEVALHVHQRRHVQAPVDGPQGWVGGLHYLGL